MGMGNEGSAFKIKNDGTIVRVDEPNNQPYPNPPKRNKNWGWVVLLMLITGGIVVYAITESNSGNFHSNNNVPTIVLHEQTDGVRGGNGGVSYSVPVKEDFKEFIRRFESDPNFQLSRVHFSQVGVPREDWGFWNDIYEGYREDENGISYVGNLTEYSDYWKWEYYIPHSGFHVQMNFTMTDGKWYVSYYHYYNN